MVRMTTRDSADRFARVLGAGQEFRTHGALSGRPGPVVSYGRLPRLFAALTAGADYAVYSYATPVAWHVPGRGWTVPAVRYSVTTARHVSRIGAAIEMLAARGEAQAAA